MDVTIDQRIQGADGQVRKVVAISGNRVTLQVGLFGATETLTLAQLQAWAAPSLPGQPQPSDYDENAPVIQTGAVTVIEQAVPESVTPRQLRLALLAAGRLDEIDAFVASDEVPLEARISWQYANEYRRDDPTLNQMAALLDPPLSAAQIDALFVAAAAIA